MKKSTIILIAALIAAVCLVVGLYVGRLSGVATELVRIEEMELLEESTLEHTLKSDETEEVGAEILSEEESGVENEVETVKNLGLMDPEVFLKKICPPSGTGVEKNQPGHIADLSFRCGDAGWYVEEHLLLGVNGEAVSYSSVGNDGIKFQYMNQDTSYMLTLKQEELETCTLDGGLTRIDDFLLDGEPLGVLSEPVVLDCFPFHVLTSKPVFQVDGVSFEIDGTRFYLDYKLKTVQHNV